MSNTNGTRSLFKFSTNCHRKLLHAVINFSQQKQNLKVKFKTCDCQVYSTVGVTMCSIHICMIRGQDRRYKISCVRTQACFYSDIDTMLLVHCL